MSKEIITYTSEKTGESKTLTKWSKSTGISASTLFCRLKRGMNIDEAIAPNPRAYESVTDPVTGDTHSLMEWAEITGMSYHTLYTRIAKNKWPIEKVLHGERYETVTRKPRPKETYKRMDLTGKRFGKLTVLYAAEEDYKYGDPDHPRLMQRWVCKCDCGRVRTVLQNNLIRGRTKSCVECNTADNKLKDMTGMKFGLLTVIERAPDKIVSGKQVTHWYCECDCGNPEIISVSGHNLRNGHTKGCGCKIGGVTHGMHGTRIYGIYRGMITRCENPNCKSYHRYGGRGIYICTEWRDKYSGFTRFYDWATANGYSDDLTIDRIDNDDGYYPGNCRWATYKEQANNRADNVHFTCNGRTMTASEWADELGVSNATLLARHKKGWSDKDIIETPVNDHVKIVTSSSGESLTLSDWSDTSGINPKTLYDRIFRLNWNVDRALVTGATNPDIYNHINYVGYVAQQNPGYYYYPYAQAIYHPAVVYTDILGRVYTQEEWEAHQAVYFD